MGTLTFPLLSSHCPPLKIVIDIYTNVHVCVEYWIPVPIISVLLPGSSDVNCFLTLYYYHSQTQHGLCCFAASAAVSMLVFMCCVCPLPWQIWYIHTVAYMYMGTHAWLIVCCGILCFTKAYSFWQELRLVLPNSQRLNRGNYVMSQLVQACRANDVTDLIIIHEHRGEPGEPMMYSCMYLYLPPLALKARP